MQEKKKNNNLFIISGANIRHLRLTCKMSQQELGKKINVTGKTVGMWERGEVGFIKKGALLAISRFFSQRLHRKITPEDILNRDLSSEDSYFKHDFFNIDVPPYIPMLPINEAGWCQDYTTKKYSPENGYEYVKRPLDVISKHAYAVRVIGVNMIPCLCPGDIAILSPDSTFIPNKIYLVRRISGEVDFHRVSLRERYYILENLNPNHSPILLREDKVVSLHLAVWVKKV